MSQHIEGNIAHDNSGREYIWQGGQWVPFDDVSGGEALLIGAGESFVDLGRGVQQLALGAGEFLGIEGAGEAQRELSELQRSDKELLAPLRERQGGAMLAGNILPSILTAPLGGSSLLGQAALGFTEGALAFGSPEERLTRGAINAAVVPAIPMAARVSSAIIDSGTKISQRGIATTGPGNFVERTLNRVLETRGKSIAEEIADETAAGARLVDDPSLTGFADDSVGAGRPAGTRGPESGIPDTNPLFGVSKEFSEVKQPISATERESMQNLLDEGFTLEPGMTDGNRAARLLSESMKSDPIFANTMDDLIQAPNKRNLNRLILQAFGKQGDEITDATLANIEEGLAREYSQVFESVPKTFEIDDVMRSNIKSIADDFESGFKSTGASDPVAKRIQKMSDLASQESMSTQQYRLFREQLRKLQRTANKADDQNSAEVYGDMVEQLDDQFSRSIQSSDNPDAFKQFNETTQRWRLLTALDRGQAIGRDGNIKLGTLSNNLKSTFKREFARDNRFKGEQLPTDEKFLKLFKSIKGLNKQQSLVGDSGTASRQAINNILSNPTETLVKLGSKGFIKRWIKNAQRFKD